MIKLTRPLCPIDYEIKAKKATDRLLESMERSESIAFDEGVWRGIKNYLLDCQGGKCAFCELSIVADRYGGDVEHYRPKGEVREFSQGGGDSYLVSRNGYYWLAYWWENLLVACAACNRKKASLFPLAAPRLAESTCLPGCEHAEEPLLLNPYEEVVMVDHLHFSELGTISAAPGSLRGLVSIRTLGLQERVGLLRSRRLIAQRATARILQLLNNPGNQLLYSVLLEDILFLGGSEQPHAGMVRIIFELLSEQGWDQLVEEFEKVTERL